MFGWLKRMALKAGLVVPPNVKTVQHSIKADCREKQLKYGTTGMCEKTSESLYPNPWMENKLYKTTDCNELYQKQYPYYMPYITYYPPVGPVSAGTRPERPLETGSVPEPKVKPAEHHQSKILPVIQEEMFGWIMRGALGIDRRSRRRLPVRPVSAGIRPERPLETGSEPEPKVNPFEHHQRMILPSSYMNLTQSDCREEPPPYETAETHNKRTDNKLSNMADLMKEREDALMAHIKSMENKLDLMKEREDVMMAHIKSMENKLSNMVDWMKEREDVLMAHIKLKQLQEEGSDSAEPEPREEPSSHSDSDDKSSCMSFSSDWSMNHITDFKGSRPSALNIKINLEDEGSDSTESELEPWDEPSSHSDSDGESSCESFKSDDSMNRPIHF